MGREKERNGEETTDDRFEQFEHCGETPKVDGRYTVFRLTAENDRCAPSSGASGLSAEFSRARKRMRRVLIARETSSLLRHDRDATR